MTDDVPRAVVGWLALTMQPSPGNHGLLGAAEKVTYSILTGDHRDQYRTRTDGWEGPIVEVAWRGGPLADTVAAALADLPDSPFPISSRERGPLWSRSNADVVIGDVWLALGVTDANPDARPEYVRRVSPWQWAEPLTIEGAARAVVIPQPAPDPATMAAAVLQTPVMTWPPEGTLMIDTQQELATWAAPQRHIARRRAFQHGRVRLHRGEAEWGIDEARDYTSAELYRLGADAGVIAVQLPRPRGQDQVYLRLALNRHHEGLDITAALTHHLLPRHNPDTAPEEHDEHITHYYGLRYSWPATAWTYLAPAVLAAAQQPDGIAPDLLIHPLGPLAGAEARYTLTITPTTRSIPAHLRTPVIDD